MSLASDALNGVGLWITRRERQQARDDAAVRSVLTAVNTTKRYLARPDRGERDREAEAELVELWTAASVHIRRTDSRLARKLQRKAEHWTNPENWTDEEIASSGIQIDDIAEEGRRLLSAV